VEICFALAIILFWKSRWTLWFTIGAMVLATLGVAVNSPAYLTAAFNPVTLNLSVAALASVGLLNGTDLPTASSCLRKSFRGDP
jgi:hypothetical protein